MGTKWFSNWCSLDGAFSESNWEWLSANQRAGFLEHQFEKLPLEYFEICADFSTLAIGENFAGKSFKTAIFGKKGLMFYALSPKCAKIKFWNGCFLGTFSNWWPLTWFKLDLCVIWMALVVKIYQNKTDLGYFHLIQFQVNICLKEVMQNNRLHWC